jgi:hypothetical protein
MTEDIGNTGGNDTPSWHIDENTPGVGDRPEWLPEKFKTVKDAMGSLSQLEKKMGTAPVDEYDFGDYKETFDPEHAAFKELSEFYKEKRVPQDVFEKTLQAIDKYGSSFVPDFAAEKASLGEGADKRIEILGNWIDSNLSKDAAAALKPLTQEYGTASSIKALEEIRGKLMSNNPSIPNGAEGDSADQETVAQLREELSDPANFKRYKEDIKYRNSYTARVNKASKNSNYVDKYNN